MVDKLEIREALATDTGSIEELYPQAFPDEDLLPVVRELQGEASGVISLVGLIDGAVVAHVMFTTCCIAETDDKVALLAPLAVSPAWQRQGIGDTIVRAGMGYVEAAGMSRVYVLGDPAYYRRFGFEPEFDVAPPYPLPEEWRGAWQSLDVGGEKSPVSGKLSVPKPWRQQALWAP